MNLRMIQISVLVAGVSATCLYAQEGYRNDVTVSVFGAFQQSTTGNDIDQSSSENAGVLATYRYLLTDHQGLELNYGYTQLGEQFLSGSTTTSLTANVDEANLSYLLRFHLTPRISPFATAGLGALLFTPTSAVSVDSTTASRFATPDFVYSAGMDISLSRRLEFRLGYRGHFFDAPDFNVSSISSKSVTTMAEPFAGLSFHF